jgi:hypothetical protein
MMQMQRMIDLQSRARRRMNFAPPDCRSFMYALVSRPVTLVGFPCSHYLGVQASQHLNGADSQFKLTFTRDWTPGLFEYDVFGNVSEWTEDCFGSNHDGAPADGSVHHVEPCTARVLQGGSRAGGPTLEQGFQSACAETAIACA